MEENVNIEISGERIWALLCYIPAFNILTCPLASVKMVNSKLVRFHARQGLALFGFWFLSVLVAIISPLLSLLLWGVALFLSILGMVIAFNGKETRIPILGQLAAGIGEYALFKLLTGKNPVVTPGEVEKTNKPVDQVQNSEQDKTN